MTGSKGDVCSEEGISIGIRVGHSPGISTLRPYKNLEIKTINHEFHPTTSVYVPEQRDREYEKEKENMYRVNQVTCASQVIFKLSVQRKIV